MRGFFLLLLLVVVVVSHLDCTAILASNRLLLFLFTTWTLIFFPIIISLVTLLNFSTRQVNRLINAGYHNARRQLKKEAKSSRDDAVPSLPKTSDRAHSLV